MSKEKSADKGIYVRKATGLVREINLFDAFVAASSTSGAVMIPVAWTTAWAMYGLPGADLVTGALVAMVISLVLVTCYGLLSATMPRSGGDYIFNSRILHPFIGFAASFNYNWIEVFWSGLVVYWIGTMAFPSSFGTLGFLLKNQTLVDIASMASTRMGATVIGIVALAIMGVILLVGTKILFRLQDALFIFGTIGMLAAVLVILTSSAGGFVSRFNDVMAPFTSSGDSFNHIIQLATDNGFAAPTSFLPGATMFGVIVALGAFGWGFYMAWIGGEFKGADSVKRQLTVSWGATLFNGLFFALIISQLYRVVSYQFMSSAQYLWDYVPSAYPLPVPPYATLYFTLLGPNPIINALIGFSIIVWPFIMTTTVLMYMTRSMFAWSFDRIMPKGLAYVSPRFHTPVVSTLVSVVGMAIAMILIAWLPSSFYWEAMAVTTMLPWISIFPLTGLAAAILPWRGKTKTLYDASPAKKYKIGGLPIMALTGVLLFVISVVVVYFYLINPSLGITDVWVLLRWIGVALVFDVVIYSVSRYYRQRQGIDLGLSFREIPAE